MRRALAVLTAAVLFAAVVLLEGCATVVKGTSQKIPVTSSPAGARVIVDGKDEGTTPLLLKLKKKKPHVIRIEREGFAPYEIRIVRNKPSRYALPQAGNATIGAAFGTVLGSKLVNENAKWTTQIGQAFLYSVLLGAAFATPLVVTDLVSGAAYSLSPKSVDIVLSPGSGASRPEVTEIDAAVLRDVKWLRIRFRSGP